MISELVLVFIIYLPCVVDLKLAYFTHSCMRGFVATRPPYSDVYHRLCLSLCLHLWCLAIS